jgi:hypothetical protein
MLCLSRTPHIGYRVPMTGRKDAKSSPPALTRGSRPFDVGSPRHSSGRPRSRPGRPCVIQPFAPRRSTGSARMACGRHSTRWRPGPAGRSWSATVPPASSTWLASGHRPDGGAAFAAAGSGFANHADTMVVPRALASPMLLRRLLGNPRYTTSERTPARLRLMERPKMTLLRHPTNASPHVSQEPTCGGRRRLRQRTSARLAGSHPRDGAVDTTGYLTFEESPTGDSSLLRSARLLC